MQSRIQRQKSAAWLAATFDLDAETSSRYPNFIGDSIEFDEAGNFLVRDFHGAIIDRLPANRFERTDDAASI